MKILFCNYEYPPLGGGGGVLNACLAEALATSHEVVVLTSGIHRSQSTEITNGVRVIRVPVAGRDQAAAASMLSMMSYLPMGVLRGLGLLRKERFDIINTHFVLPSGPVGAFLSAAGAIPNVLTVHGGDLYDPSKASSPHRHSVFRLTIRALLKSADVVVGQSSDTINNVHKYYLSDLKCETIPLGIKRRQFPVSNRAALGISPDEFVMVTVGRLVARKAVEQLIEMMAKLTASNVRLIVIGEGPQKSTLEDLAQATGLSGRVTFAGFVSEERKMDLLAASDLYVSTSQHEGFGLVFLEAMAAGIPIVSYNCGGHGDFLEDGKTGAVVALNDLDSFTRTCQFYMESADARRIAREENLKRVESYYIDTCARRYEALFSEIIASRRMS